MPDKEAPNSSPFRREALEYIATPKALDTLTQIPSPALWILAAGLWLITLSLILWLFFGSIPFHIQGKGIMTTHNEALIYISALDSEYLKTDSSLSISPLSHRKWENQRTPGRIIAIDNQPATPKSVLTLLRNPSLVYFFLKDGPVIFVRAQVNHKTYLPPGSLIDVRLTIHRKSPIALLISRSY